MREGIEACDGSMGHIGVEVERQSVYAFGDGWGALVHVRVQLCQVLEYLIRVKVNSVKSILPGQFCQVNSARSILPGQFCQVKNPLIRVKVGTMIRNHVSSGWGVGAGWGRISTQCTLVAVLSYAWTA